MKPQTILREALLALALFLVGLIILPAAIYVVGQQIIGEYESGLSGYYESLAAALAAPNGFAWLLVLSPYLTIQLLRLMLLFRRLKRPVN